MGCCPRVPIPSWNSSSLTEHRRKRLAVLEQRLKEQENATPQILNNQTTTQE